MNGEALATIVDKGNCGYRFQQWERSLEFSKGTALQHVMSKAGLASYAGEAAALNYTLGFWKCAGLQMFPLPACSTHDYNTATPLLGLLSLIFFFSTLPRACFPGICSHKSVSITNNLGMNKFTTVKSLWVGDFQNTWLCPQRDSHVHQLRAGGSGPALLRLSNAFFIERHPEGNQTHPMSNSLWQKSRPIYTCISDSNDCCHLGIETNEREGQQHLVTRLALMLDNGIQCH